MHSRAVTQGQIADILVTRGELDEALRIRTEEQLPVFEQLGDVRSRAITQGEIADIFEARGELDEALRIRTEEELPIYERLGDVRSRAITQGKIADILVTRGELDEALRIRARGRAACLRPTRRRSLARDRAGQDCRHSRDPRRARRGAAHPDRGELPVYDRLGDVRSRAITQGQIADILVTRGELDEALRIRTEEQLPVFEQLGDVRSRAITQGQVADIFEARGELDDALRIWIDEVLPFSSSSAIDPQSSSRRNESRTFIGLAVGD